MKNLEYIQCPSRKPFETLNTPTLFLAGGITNCPDWQTSLKNLLFSSKNSSNLTIFNPRRADPFDFSKENEKQILWEFEHLAQSDAVSFWFPKESICPITLFELGTRMIVKEKPVFVGCDPEYSRKPDLLVQIKLYRPEIKLVFSLESLQEEIESWRTEILLKKSRSFEGFYGKIKKIGEIFFIFAVGAVVGWKIGRKT